MTATQRVVCPKCGSADVVPIVFGYPTRETQERADRGEAYLGGCIVPSSGQWADHACRACGHEWAEQPSPGSRGERGGNPDG